MLTNDLLAKLKAELAKPTKEFGGSFEHIVRVLSDMRAESAVGHLVSALDTQLSGAPPMGIWLSSVDYYPVARALARIGGRDMAQSLLRRAAYPMDDIFLRLSVWVLVESYGEELTRAMIQPRLQSINKVVQAKSEALGKPADQFDVPEKKNLERIIALLDSKEELIPFPKTVASPQEQKR
jgi:hypothetical protein